MDEMKYYGDPQMFVLAVIHGLDKDISISLTNMIQNLHKDVRKFFIGPISNGDHKVFVVIPNNTHRIQQQLVMHKSIERMIEIINWRGAILMLQMGTGQINIIKSSDKDIYTPKVEEYKAEVDKVKTICQTLKKELADSISLRNKDEVIRMAVEDLLALRRKRGVVEAAQAALSELKALPQTPAIKILIERTESLC